MIGKNTKNARSTCPQMLWKIARRKLDRLNFAISLQDLLVPPGNKLESLKGDRSGQYSIRINDRYRICFTLIDETFEQVEIVDYH